MTIIKIVWYWHKDRQIEYWNRIGSPQIDPLIYSQIIFDKNVGVIQQKKEYLQQVMLEQLEFYKERKRLNPYTTTDHKLITEWSQL